MTLTDKAERRALIAEGIRQQGRGDFYETNRATPRTTPLNTFQKWADDYARAFGLIVIPCGNWVTIYQGSTSREAMSAKGVQAICAELCNV